MIIKNFVELNNDNCMNLYSKKTSKLSKIEINEICKLKNSHWKYGIISQKNFFFKNVGLNDIHNLVIMEKKIIGYTLLRQWKISFSKSQKRYLHFDTLIINKNLRGKKISKKLMELNNNIIRKKKSFSILLCEKSMIKFYKKFRWKILQKKYVIGKKSKKTYMIYNKEIRRKLSFHK